MTRKGGEGIFGGEMGTENPTHFPYYEGGNDLINFGGSLVNQDSVSLPIFAMLCCWYQNSRTGDWQDCPPIPILY